MKISNETKVGALTAIAITLLILGFNFLKGKSIFKTGTYIYAKFKNTKGMMVSNPVFINGLQVGAIDDMEEASKNLDSIIVSVKLTKDVNIPNNSLAQIKSSPLGGSSLDIFMGNSNSYIKSGDTIRTTENPGLLSDLSEKLDPLVTQVTTTLHSMDSVMRNINSVFDPSTKNNMQDVVANINRVTANLVVSSAQLQTLLNSQSGVLASSLNNVNAFTKNLSANNERITSTLTNLETTTTNFSKADIQGTVAQLQTSIAKLNAGISKIDSREGSIGLLLNDTQLYNNLANTSRSLNILMDDLRVNPKRYLTIGVSLFGSKSKAQPLMKPLPVNDTTTVNTATTSVGKQ
jgi:phospholipid/cholesterol/gamma-HCH transport system substrate-binding protein